MNGENVRVYVKGDVVKSIAELMSLDRMIYINALVYKGEFDECEKDMLDTALEKGWIFKAKRIDNKDSDKYDHIYLEK